MTAPERTASGGDGPTDRQPPLNCDVLIVGGGPTGLFLACLLAARDVDVLVLERRAAPSAHSRGIGLHPPALAALEMVGLESAAMASGSRIRRGVARSRGHDLGQLHFAQAWPNRPFVLSVPQSRTEKLLESRLVELAPEALRRGWEVTSLQETTSGVEVTAQPRDQSVPAVLRTRVIVGADGAHGRVRDLLGIGATGSQYPDAYLMGDLADPVGERVCRNAFIHLEPGGVVESFPLPDGRRRWVVHMGPAPPSAATAAALVEKVRERTGVQLDPESATMISAFTVRRRTARRLVSCSGALIGDAAHEISPIGGQGITLGWLDALDVVPVLLRATTATDGPLHSSAAWQAFARRCRRRARTAGLLAYANTALGRPLPVPLARTRDIAVRGALGTSLRHVLAWAYSMGWAWSSRQPPRRMDA
ncbi:FAD-dependent oxidoreductase [Brachybacterium sp. GCM10030252]|uniref:FAD-dependent oxidoreductase n=1 Tax=Brachybacterium sp. GCM10030252 TaxID=3273380 RepID=UPI0036119D41